MLCFPATPFFPARSGRLTGARLASAICAFWSVLATAQPASPDVEWTIRSKRLSAQLSANGALSFQVSGLEERWQSIVPTDSDVSVESARIGTDGRALSADLSIGGQ